MFGVTVELECVFGYTVTRINFEILIMVKRVLNAKWFMIGYIYVKVSEQKISMQKITF